MFEDIPQTPDAIRKRIQFIYDEIQKELSNIKDGSKIRILDIGCGTGELITIPLGCLGTTVIGIDTHLPSIEYARTRNRYDNVHFNCISVDELNDQKFDFIICSEVLEHLNEPARMLSSIKKLLKPGGICIITIPNGYGPKEIEGRLYKILQTLRLVTPLQHSKNIKRKLYKGTAGGEGLRATFNTESRHIQFFSYLRFKNLLEKNGFHIRKMVNRRFLSGPFSNILLSRSEKLIDWNVSIADKLPYFLVSSWMFIVEHEIER